MKRRSKILVATAVAVPLVLGGAAAAYAVHYQDRALPRTSVVGLDLAGKSRSEIVAALTSRVEGVAIDVRTPTGTESASLADLGYVVDVDATVEKVLEANRTWTNYARAPFTDRTVEVVVTENAKAFEKYVQGLVGKDVRVAANASVVMADDKLSFTVKPGVTGRAADPADLEKVAAIAARTLNSAAARVDLVEANPKITTAAAQKVADQANALVHRTVQFSERERTFTATTAEKASWVTLGGSKDALGKPALDSKKVAAWVSQSADVATVNGTRYLNSKGEVVRVITTARDGVRVTNPEVVARTLAESLAAGRDGTATAQFKALPATWTERTLAPGAENLAYPAVPGEKWIDVNLARHTMTAYLGGEAVFGPVAVVNGAAATPTDIGTFHIYLKNPLMTMRGANADGTNYETPNVPWSSFFNGGEALHGAYWRDTFGYAASHGCVNLPIDTAKWVYDWAPIGTPVVTHN